MRRKRIITTIGITSAILSALVISGCAQKDTAASEKKRKHPKQKHLVLTKSLPAESSAVKV